MKKLPGPNVGQDLIDKNAQDLMRAISLLFPRCANRSLADRPGFSVVPAGGTEYVAEVGCRASPYHGPEVTFKATGSGPLEALLALKLKLVEVLNLRIRSDVGALELAGHSFDWTEGYGKHTPVDDGTVVTTAEVSDDRPDASAVPSQIQQRHGARRR